jgi:hypothetical protein
MKSGAALFVILRKMTGLWIFRGGVYHSLNRCALNLRSLNPISEFWASESISNVPSVVRYLNKPIQSFFPEKPAWAGFIF